MSRIATRPEEGVKPSPSELAQVFSDLKSGKTLSDDQHEMLEKALNVAAKREPAMVAQVAFQQEVYSGPLPHYDQLNGYDEETRRAIVDMAVREQSHSHNMYLTGLNGAIQKDRRGQYCALVVAVVGLGAAAWISQYSPTAAAVIGGIDLIGLVSVFMVPRIAEQRAAQAAEKESSPQPPSEKKRPRGGKK